MPAEHKSNRCAQCDTNWPIGDLFKERCPACGAEVFATDMKPDHSYHEAKKVYDETEAWSRTDTEELAVPTPATARGNRVERYLHYGFSVIEAEILADAKVTSMTQRPGKQPLTWTLPLYHGDVKAQLDRGMSHSEAVRLYA